MRLFIDPTSLKTPLFILKDTRGLDLSAAAAQSADVLHLYLCEKLKIMSLMIMHLIYITDISFLFLVFFKCYSHNCAASFAGETRSGHIISSTNLLKSPSKLHFLHLSPYKCLQVHSLSSAKHQLASCISSCC